MPAVADRHIRQLRAYLVGNQPKANGEWDMYCPIHGDVNRRSASLNVLSGAWYCNSCGSGGGVLDLIRRRSQWTPRGVANTNGNGHYSLEPKQAEPSEIITMGMVEGWHSNLMSDESVADYLISRRGIHTKTLADYKIGYDGDKRVYTIPIFGTDGSIWNIRRYTPVPRPNGSKIWSVRGMRVTELYPLSVFEMAHRVGHIIIGEGEWDMLLTIQSGFPAITRTAGANKWDVSWNVLFKGLIVYLIHDCDTEGQSANRRIAQQMVKQGIDARPITLPFEVVEKHGEDLSDYWSKYDRNDFEKMLAASDTFEVKKAKDPKIITVLDSFDSHKVGSAVKLQVTIKGKKDPGYSIPRKATLSCTRDAGAICQVCPMFAEAGTVEVEVAPESPAVLGLIDSPQAQVMDHMRSIFGAQKCKKLTIEVTDHQAVEVLFARPSIDHADGTKATDYKNVKITSVGRHDTMPNNTVVVTGALYPNPRDQHNEFLGWEVERQETSVDRFELTADSIKLMKRFQPRKGQTPLQKLGSINRDLAAHVTRIVGRPEMHALMDLTFHSVLSFKFGGQLVHRGWLESLVVGDTRTGKSEAAERLVRHFGAGEIVGGEAATLAGLVGGMQQIGGKDWAVTWGVIPLNDRRIVVIDELSGLSPDDIAKMSDVRASGMARLTKILQEVTYARTRLLWLGNPRHGGMDQFTYGVDAIKPLIGNPEDIARFDLGMAVARNDVPPSEFNKRIEAGELRYTAEACHTALMWCWTRQVDQIVWAKGAEDHVYKLALEIGQRYTEDPPLMQAANARIKIARLAAALAARTFSTDETFENVVVTAQHVQDAVTFMDLLYEMPSFGYAERSRERLMDLEEARENHEKIRIYLLENRGLAKFLRGNPRFRGQDIQEVLNKDRDTANAMISKLFETRMLRKDHGDNIVEPELHGLLREVRW